MLNLSKDIFMPAVCGGEASVCCNAAEDKKEVK